MQFDVYENKNPSTRRRFPYLLDVQSDLLDGLATRVVAPLAAQKTAFTRLMPAVRVLGKEYVVYIPQLAGVTRSRLGKLVANLSESRPEVIAALDLLLTGV